MATAKNIDIKKYMGTWFEIARIETPFQRGKYNSMAVYKLNPDKTVSIENSATTKNGKRTTAKATAYVPNPEDSSKLRVSFFRPFYSDYWILDIDTDYQWALVGTPSKKYLWILSRRQSIDDATLIYILNSANSRGFDVSKLIYNINLSKDFK